MSKMSRQKAPRQRKKVRFLVTKNRSATVRLPARKHTAITLALIVALVIVYLMLVPIRIAFDNSTTPPNGLDKNAVSDLAWARQRLGYIKSQLDDVTGLKISSSWNNNCSLANNQAWLDETKDCVTEVDGKYTVPGQSQANAIETDIYCLAVSPNGFNSSCTGISKDYGEFDTPQNNLLCSWSFTPTAENVKENAQTQVGFYINCEVTTTKQIYPEQD
jgi:hypothetical protein